MNDRRMTNGDIPTNNHLISGVSMYNNVILHVGPRTNMNGHLVCPKHRTKPYTCIGVDENVPYQASCGGDENIAMNLRPSSKVWNYHSFIGLFSQRILHSARTLNELFLGV